VIALKIEGRSEERKFALIFFSGRAGVRSCGITDVTNCITDQPIISSAKGLPMIHHSARQLRHSTLRRTSDATGERREEQRAAG
jgi:hypothetical protein